MSCPRLRLKIFRTAIVARSSTAFLEFNTSGGWLLARMYNCIGCETSFLCSRNASFARSVLRNPIKKENPANYRAFSQSVVTSVPLPCPPPQEARIPLGQNSNDYGYARDYPLSFLALFVRREQEKRKEKSRGSAAWRGENGDNSGWPGRLRSFRALTRLIAGPRIRALRSTAESVYFKRHRARVTLASGALALAFAKRPLGVFSDVDTSIWHLLTLERGRGGRSSHQQIANGLVIWQSRGPFLFSIFYAFRFSKAIAIAL